MDFGLSEWFASGHTDMFGRVSLCLCQYLLNGGYGAAIEGIGGITPATTQGAACEPNKNGRRADAACFALKGVKNLSDA